MKNTWVIKFGLFNISLVGSLIVLELGMRLLGWQMLSSREAGFLQEKLKYEREEYLIEKEPDFQYRVVTLGDSSTNGGNVHLRDTYPFQLFNIQQKSPLKNKFNILNFGICEYNSYRTLNQIIDNFDTYNPDVVILLSGEADRFNPIGLDKEVDSNKKIKLWSLISHFRVFKMARGIWLNWKFKKESDRPFYPNYSGGKSDIPLLMQNYDQVKRIANLFKNGWYKQAREVIATLDEDFAKSVNFDYQGDDPLRYFYILLEDSELIGAVYTNYLHQGQNREAIQFLLKVLKDFPVAFSYEESSIFYDMSVSFDFQSQVKASEIIKVFDDAVLHDPNIKNSLNFKRYFPLFKNKDQFRKQVNKNRKKNLQKIIDFLLEKNIPIIVQNYPGNWMEANSDLELLAKKNKLPFVDNHKKFQLLMDEKNRKKYLEDDEHPTPLGYKIMAQNVWQELKKLKTSK
ncbi:MAG: hypothetical protein HN509_03495 [Halobacteriovoraceae bacterium]|jgi:lysophospholipase L1-like esterase|nr:hypothetical protein [Halobacteriovoraceae bacterium]